MMENQERKKKKNASTQKSFQVIQSSLQHLEELLGRDETWVTFWNTYAKKTGDWSMGPMVTKVNDLGTTIHQSLKSLDFYVKNLGKS